jgi:hypothetical protein
MHSRELHVFSLSISVPALQVDHQRGVLHYLQSDAVLWIENKWEAITETSWAKQATQSSGDDVALPLKTAAS